MFRKIRNRIKFIRKFIRIIKIYISAEKTPEFNITNLREKLYCYKKGFFPDKYYLYNFKENNSKYYISDIFDIFTHPKNGHYSRLIDNKAFLPITIKNFQKYLPVYYFTIWGSQILDQSKNRYINRDTFLFEIKQLLEKKEKVILKPFAKESGDGFILLSKNGDSFYYNNENISESELNRRLLLLNNYICTEFVQNAEYIKQIFPYSCNTIRILTIWDKRNNKPYIARALHKFGTIPEKTFDNVIAGGITSEINIQDGTLSQAFLWKRKDGVNEFSDYHPTTKKIINGVKISNWETILSKIIEIATNMPYLKYMGWDIAVTEDAFKIIEINSNPGLIIFQVHRPLLTDPKIKEFFDQYKNNDISERYYEK